MKKIQRQKIETFGNTVIVDKIRNLILDSDFQKFEEENPDLSVFQELLLTKQRKFDKSSMSMEKRKDLIQQFRTVYQRTGLAKLPQMIEMIDILLENRISFVIAAYHTIVVEAFEAALEKRKVAFINISPFFVNDEDQ